MTVCAGVRNWLAHNHKLLLELSCYSFEEGSFFLLRACLSLPRISLGTAHVLNAEEHPFGVRETGLARLGVGACRGARSVHIRHFLKLTVNHASLNRVNVLIFLAHHAFVRQAQHLGLLLEVKLLHGLPLHLGVCHPLLLTSQHFSNLLC